MINIIQIVLVCGLLFIAMYFYKKIRSSNLDSFFIIIFVMVGIFLILFPKSSNNIAHFFGVGRGADLVFYLSFLFFSFILMKLYAKIRKLEMQITELTRERTLSQKMQ